MDIERKNLKRLTNLPKSVNIYEKKYLTKISNINESLNSYVVIKCIFIL